MLGGLWVILNPLAMILVYTAVFSEVMQAKLPGVMTKYAYSIYLCSGLLTWQYFVETVQRLQNIFIDQSSLIKKVSFPKSSLPIYVLISSTINFLIVFSIFLIFLILNGNFPGAILINIIPLLIIQQMIALGLGIFVGTLNVFYRDIGHVFSIVIQFWFWFTPIVYTVEAIPQKFKDLLEYNVIVPLMNGYQNILLLHTVPNWKSLSPVLIFALVCLLLGYLVFKKLSKEMVDEL